MQYGASLRAMATSETTRTEASSANLSLDHLLRQRASLIDVIKSTNSEPELRPLLTRIIRHACELLDSTTGSIGLYDEQKDLIRIEADFNMPPGNVGRELKTGTGIAGLVLEKRRAVILARYDEMPRMADPAYRSHAVLGVPIFWRDQLIGTFGVSASPPRLFGSGDVEVLTIYARHAAVAIQNARQYRREAARNERLALLARMGRALAADLDLDTLCTNAVQMMHQHLGYPNVGLGLIDPDDPQTIVIRHLAGG